MLDKTFDPKEVEARIFDQWVASGAFKAGRRPGAEPFCIVIPPPNVTGRLHIGHALNNTLQDVLTRFERMRGKDVLWQPGMDHAGIATQLVVERELAKQGKKRSDMTREEFIEQVWQWKNDCGGAILNQQKRLGNSADWDRARFTMDEGLSRAVLKVFVRLYNEKLIYKDKRLVNWDPSLQTAVSDLEVESVEVKGNLWHLKYPVEGTDEFIIVATTRPETMLGDTAVAVHPENEKLKHLIGKQVRLPLVNRLIPIVGDEHADPEKGTGAVKITPAHDFDDFEVGKRHNLPIIGILTKDAKIVSDNAAIPEKYRGLDRFEARKVIVADFEALELLDKIEPIVHAVPHDEKTKSVMLEPMLTEQWYLDVRPLAAKAIKAVEDGKTKFVPENWGNVYFNWLRNIQPWCVSRQLWWGHQIPVWYCPVWNINDPQPHWIGNDHVAAESDAEAIRLATKYYTDRVDSFGLNKDTIKVEVLSEEPKESWITIIEDVRNGKRSIPIWRDPDVLDTWFSSALWPFSTLGWPDETAELKRYYPTSVLITGFDIIFFWVARMMMMGIHFMDGDVPFERVFIHTRVLDEHGKKMSKTKGNVVDPLELVDAYGADALRFTLALAAGLGKDMRIGPSRVEVNRNFATKLWNATRFSEMNGCQTVAGFDPSAVKQQVNQWIVAETAAVAADVTKALEELHFNDAAGSAYHFVWDVFCDWYLEFAKPLFQGSDEAAKAETRATTAWVRDQILKLLHPFMPYITEELWARTEVPEAPRGSLLIEAAWPDLSTLPAFTEAAAEMRWVIELIAGTRSVRAEMNVPASAKIDLVLVGANEQSAARLARHQSLIQTLARLATATTAATVPAASAQFVIGEATVALPLEGVIDIAKEKARLEKDLKKAADEITRFEAKLNNPQFVAKAPEDVLTEQRERLAEAQDLQKRLGEAIARLG